MGHVRKTMTHWKTKMTCRAQDQIKPSKCKLLTCSATLKSKVKSAVNLTYFMCIFDITYSTLTSVGRSVSTHNTCTDVPAFQINHFLSLLYPFIQYKWVILFTANVFRICLISCCPSHNETCKVEQRLAETLDSWRAQVSLVPPLTLTQVISGPHTTADTPD